MLTMYQQITIITLHKQGIKHAKIAKQMGCHRNTIRHALQRPSPIEKQTRNKSSILDPYKKTIEKWKNENVSRLQIIEKLRDELGVRSSYINVCKYMQKHFPKAVEAFGVQLTEAWS